MITTGFEIAFGIFLFIVALIILMYVLAGSGIGIMLLWDWVRRLWGKGNLWVQAIIIYFVFMVSVGILALLGVGR